MADPRRQAYDRLDRASRDACDTGDHLAEAELTAQLVATADPRATADLIHAHLADLRAREHLTWTAADADRVVALGAWVAAAVAAHAAIAERLDEDEASPNARRTALDPLAASLRRAQEATGSELSPAAADLARREAARRGPRPDGATFFARHRDG